MTRPLNSLQSRIYPGYVVVIVCFILMVSGWGIYYIYGVFFGPLESEFNWTRAVTSGGFSVSVLMSGVVGIVAGRLSDRVGPKAVIMFCGVFLALGYSLMSLVHSTWQFYLFYGLFIATGVGGFWAPLVSTVARWFAWRWGLMIGIVSGGISFGTLVLPPLVAQLIAVFDWRITYLIIGGMILVVVMTAAQFLKPSPQHMGLLPLTSKSDGPRSAGLSPAPFSFGQAVRAPQFWMISLIYLCFGAIQLTVMVHIVPYATGLGNSPIRSAVVLSIIGGVSLAGRMIMGSVADRLQVRIATISCLGLLLLALLWLQFADSLWRLYLFAAVFGFGYGGLSCLQSVIGAEFFGLAALGVITAVFSFSFNIGGALGPVLAGYVFDVSASYGWAFVICLALAAAALLISLNLKRPQKP